MQERTKFPWYSNYSVFNSFLKVPKKAVSFFFFLFFRTPLMLSPFIFAFTSVGAFDGAITSVAFFYFYVLWFFESISISTSPLILGFCINITFYFGSTISIIFDLGCFCFGINIKVNITFDFVCSGINFNITFDFGFYCINIDFNITLDLGAIAFTSFKPNLGKWIFPSVYFGCFGINIFNFGCIHININITCKFGYVNSFSIYQYHL